MRARRPSVIILLLAVWMPLIATGCGAIGAPPPRDLTTVEAARPEMAPDRRDARGNDGAGVVTAAPPVAAPVVTRPDRDAPSALQLSEAVVATAPAPLPVVVPPAPARPAVATHDDYLYVPPSAVGRQPVTVLVALHGVGGEGPGFCKSLLAEADRNGWVVLAPTYRYENWHDPAAVARDDMTILPRLRAAIDAVPERTGLRVRGRVLLYGFSRGAQVAHRFALAYPRQVLGVAALSAGTYTLPDGEWSAAGARRPLPLPFGTADLGQRLGVTPDAAALGRVSFWVGVGGQDNREADVPAAWNAYIGKNRVERARAFTAALDRLGIPAQLTIFPGVDHTETPVMRAAASAYLRTLTDEGGTRSPLAS